MEAQFNIPQRIDIYIEGKAKLNFLKLKQFINKHFGKTLVHFIRLKKPVVQTQGLLFKFLATQESFETVKRALSKIKADKNCCEIILTNKIFATFGDDKRLHIRASVYGFPSVISTAGIAEGPAKPKEYYLYKQKYTQLGIWDIEEPKLKRKFKGRFIDYQDKRLEEVLKGYISQALFFYITAEPFCEKKSCRLYNAHWQEDLIYAQVKSAKFCAKHRRFFKQLKDCNRRERKMIQ